MFIAKVDMKSLLQTFNLIHAFNLNRPVRQYLYEYLMPLFLSRTTPRLAFPFTRPHPLCIPILWSCKVFFVQMKIEINVEILRRMMEAGNGLLTQSSMHVNVNVPSSKTKIFSNTKWWCYGKQNVKTAD